MKKTLNQWLLSTGGLTLKGSFLGENKEKDVFDKIGCLKTSPFGQ